MSALNIINRLHKNSSEKRFIFTFFSIIFFTTLFFSTGPLWSAPDEMSRTSSRQWYKKAVDYNQLAKKDQAIECLEIALDLNPNNQQARSLIDRIRGKVKKINTLKSSIVPKKVPSREAMNFYNQAKKLILKGDYLKAKNCLEIALEMDEYNFQVKDLLNKVVQKIKFEKFKSEKELFLAKRNIDSVKSNRPQIYIVKKGDTLGKIAKNQMGSFIKYKDLAKYNNISINTLLKIGQTLKIPVKGSASASKKYTTNHFVPKKSPSLKRLEKKLGALPSSSVPKPLPSFIPENRKLEKRVVQVIEVNNSGKRTSPFVTSQKNSRKTRAKVSPVKAGPEIFYKPVPLKRPVAKKRSREIFDIKPKTAKDYYELAQGYWKLGKIEQAMENYSKAIKMDPSYLSKGRSRMIDDSILRLEEKSSSDPEAFAKLHLKLADMLQKRGELELASRELLRAIELDETNEEAYFTLGMIYEKLGEKNLAVSTYEKINEMFASRSEIISLASDRIAVLIGQTH